MEEFPDARVFFKRVQSSIYQCHRNGRAADLSSDGAAAGSPVLLRGRPGKFDVPIDNRE
jgi:hypothetical protein